MWPQPSPCGNATTPSTPCGKRLDGKPRGDQFCSMRGAVARGDHRNIVARTNPPVLPLISKKCRNLAIERWRSSLFHWQRLQCRNSLKCKIVRMDVLAGGDRGEGFAHGAPVPDHLFSRLDFAQRDFVTCRNRPLRPDLMAADNNGLPRREWNPRDGDIISGMQLDSRRGGGRGSPDVQQTHDPNIRVLSHLEKAQKLNPVFSVSKLIAC